MPSSDTRKLTEEEAEEAEFALLRRDADIEADYQRVVAQTKAAGKAKRGGRHVGFPWAFMLDVCRATHRHPTAALVAILIYRRTIVCKARTVTLPGAELAELGIGRTTKYRALARLEKAGLVRVERGRPGRPLQVTLLWQTG
jgi:hypothetical protein